MNVKTTRREAPFRFTYFQILAPVIGIFLSGQAMAQNNCGTAVAIGPGTYTVDAINGTNVIGLGCSNAAMAEWYVYTPTENHSVTVTSDLQVNMCKDTNFSVYTGNCSGLTCYTSDDDSGTIQCNGNGSSFLSRKTFDVFAGTTYYIAWDNRWQVTGFDFQLIEQPFIENPCNTAVTVTAGVTTVAAIDALALATPCSTASMAKWYEYIPSQDYHVTVTSDLAANTCKDTKFNVYTGSCTNLSCFTSDDNSGEITCETDSQSNLSYKEFDVTGGTTYYIAWDNTWSAEGFDFEIIEEAFVYPVQYVTQPLPSLNSTYNTCVVDMNGDGLDDIAGVSSNNLRVHFQQAEGGFTFSDFPVSGTSFMPSWSIAAGEYNKDGYTDLLLGAGSGLSFWRSNATGTAYTSVTPGDYIFCQRTNFIDINNDGNLDAFSCHDIAPNCYYMNDGSANMTFYQSSGPNLFGMVGGNYASIWTDYNNDGKADLFVSKCSGPPCELHRNNGDGTWSDVASVSGLNFQPVQSWSSSVADFDNDGDMDILVGSNGSVASRLFRNEYNDGTGAPDAFTNITAGSGWDSNLSSNRDYIAYDFDNDGNLDVLGGGNKIMFGQGDGTFEATAYNSGISVGAVGDLNADGFLDIIDWGSNVRMAVPNGNHWIVVNLHGIQSNGNGIGARVEIYGPFGKKIRDIRSGEGFEYMSTLNAHFGIGQFESVDSIVVRWPSGVVDVIEDPQIDSFVALLEGSSPLSVATAAQDSFGIYPNPSENQLNIVRGNLFSEVHTAEIYDLSGRLVANPVIDNDQLSVTNLSSGTYFLVLRTGNGKSFAQRFIKK